MSREINSNKIRRDVKRGTDAKGYISVDKLESISTKNRMKMIILDNHDKKIDFIEGLNVFCISEEVGELIRNLYLGSNRVPISETIVDTISNCFLQNKVVIFKLESGVLAEEGDLYYVAITDKGITRVNLYHKLEDRYKSMMYFALSLAEGEIIAYVDKHDTILSTIKSVATYSDVNYIHTKKSPFAIISEDKNQEPIIFNKIVEFYDKNRDSIGEQAYNGLITLFTAYESIITTFAMIYNMISTTSNKFEDYLALDARGIKVEY